MSDSFVRKAIKGKRQREYDTATRSFQGHHEGGFGATCAEKAGQNVSRNSEKAPFVLRSGAIVTQFETDKRAKL